MIVARTSEIAPGKAKVVEVDGRQVAVFNIDGSFHAIPNICPHRGGPLAEGHVEGKIVVCPWHAWEFDVTNGSCLTVPQSRLKCYAVKVSGDDISIEI